MKIINSEKYTATVTIGLQRRYTENQWNKNDVVYKLQAIQNQFIEFEKIYLSAAISECDIVLSGQVEPSLKFDFINYPKFPLSELVFKVTVLKLANQLMNILEQNRVVVVFHNDITMLENNCLIDPRIKLA
ncbi:hypothetical protein [Confluentibacter citreus]|uniref:hypothetical protein n=1 Tax=Confluentibacter citreus TaxID=2007307 RepID=UPI0012FE2FDB|nr:hypothetical protein [Confluentibacter citreus]